MDLLFDNFSGMNNQASYHSRISISIANSNHHTYYRKIASIQPVKESASNPIGYEVPKSDKVTSDGKLLFWSKCASCHNVFKDGTGPALAGFEERGL